MTDKDLVPKRPNEVVIPVGKAKLITTKEKADEALEIAGRIFREEGNKAMEELEIAAAGVDRPIGNVATTDAVEITQEEIRIEPCLVELSEAELEALPNAKYGRDAYGRALNKNGTPRKARNDKGIERGKYGPRKPKNDPVDETPTPAPVAVAAENAGDSGVF